MARTSKSQRKGRASPRPSTFLAENLEYVRRQMLGIESMHAFHRTLTEPDEAAGRPALVSYAAVRNYHQGKGPDGNVRQPDAAYLARLKEICPQLNVTWLVTGEGEPTVSGEFARLAAEREANDRDLQVVDDLIPDVDDPDQPRYPRRARRAALLRFARRLQDIRVTFIPWVDKRADRDDVLRAAAAFLEAVDVPFAIEAPLSVEEQKRRPLLHQSDAWAWWNTWYDAALDLFARRVRGLGERSGGLDSHVTVVSGHAPTVDVQPTRRTRTKRGR